MTRREYNLRDLQLLEENNQRIKDSLNKHKHLPVEHCVTMNLSYRVTRDALKRLNRSIRRAK